MVKSELGIRIFIMQIFLCNHEAFEKTKSMEEYMERPRGEKMIHTADGHRLCTVHHIEEKDCTARFATGCLREIPD